MKFEHGRVQSFGKSKEKHLTRRVRSQSPPFFYEKEKNPQPLYYM